MAADRLCGLQHRLSVRCSGHRALGSGPPSPDRPAVPVGPIPFRYPGSQSAAVSSSCVGHAGRREAVVATSSADAGGGGCRGDVVALLGGQWPNPTTVSEDLLRMFEESTLSDLEVVCTAGAGCKFKAHRLVLAARSPVFKAMFLTGMREKRAGLVFLEDVSAEAVKCMLDFSYKDECPELDEGCILDTLKIANKYDIPGLRDICLDFMAQNARSDNIVGYLAACDSYRLLDFKHLLLSALVDNPPALHECIHGQNLDAYPEIMKQLLTACAHQLSRTTKDRHVVKQFDGLPYRSQCYLCVREVASMPKQMLGEMLFPMVQKLRPEHASKITGMIIELDNLELVPLFESENALREKVEEAVLVLREADRAASDI